MPNSVTDADLCLPPHDLLQLAGLSRWCGEQWFSVLVLRAVGSVKCLGLRYDVKAVWNGGGDGEREQVGDREL